MRELKIKIESHKEIENTIKELGGKFLKEVKVTDFYLKQPKSKVLKVSEEDNMPFLVKLKSVNGQFEILEHKEINEDRKKELIDKHGIDTVLKKRMRLFKLKDYKVNINLIENVGEFLILEGETPKKEFITDKLNITNPEFIEVPFSNLSRKDRVKSAFNDFVNEYGEFMDDTKHNRAKIKILHKLKSEINGKVLDVATGTGDVALWIAQNTQAESVTGVDFSQNMINKAKLRAKDKNLEINLSVGDIGNLSYNDNEFDTVICCLGFCWFTEREKALNEITRVCKNNGKIIFLEEEGNLLSVQKISEEGNNNSNVSAFEEIEEHLPPETIEEMMIKQDFKLARKTQTIPIDENHSLLGMVFSR